MSTRTFVPLALFVTAAVACGDVPDDPGGPGGRLFAAAGVIEGTVLYQGPRPCSMGGHIVGNAILLIFDRRNLPPPNGLAVISSNFADVTGDVLFANEPRYTGTDAPYCPTQHGFTDTITVTAPFAVSPMAAGSYEIQAFFDYTGDFLPTFKFRELPEQGDVGGGDIDTADALKAINAGNPNYSPDFLPVEIGTPEAIPTGTTLPPGYIPPYDLPSSGYVAQNVTVSLGQVLADTRPYVYAFGLPYGQSTLSPDGTSIMNTTALQESDTAATNTNGVGSPTTTPPGSADTDQNYLPVLTIPQDIQTLSAPDPTDLTGANANVDLFEAVLPHLNLKFGVPTNELPCATGGTCSGTTVGGQTNPFHFQLQSGGSSEGAISVWQDAYFDPTSQTWNPLLIPEGNDAPFLWPEVILSKLVDSTPPEHPEDPASLTAQGSAGQPVVIIQGITLLNAGQTNPLSGMNAQSDTLFNTVLGLGSSALLPGGGAYNGTLFNQVNGLFTTPTVFQQDHLTVAVRPAVICFSHLFDDPVAVDTRGTLVSPFSGGKQASFAGNNVTGPVVPTDILSNGDVTHRYQATGLVNTVQFGCLPRGRYAINVVYPDGQAWTVPNETGACSASEGTTEYAGLTCSLKPRPVLYSQGNRAVVEVVGPTNPANCQNTGPAASPTFNQSTVPIGGPAPSVPVSCLPRCETQACPGSDSCTQVSDANGGSAMVCLPPCPPNVPNCHS
jgi:hypothetical protein